MANKTTTTIKSKNGKTYDYCRISPKVEIYDEETGQFILKKKQFTGKNLKEAKKKLSDHEEYIEALKAELSKSTSEKLAERTFGVSVKAFIDNTFMPDSSIKNATKTRYINSYKNIFDGNRILKKPLKDVCGEDIQAVFSQSDYAPSSKEAALKLLRNYYKYAASQHIAHDVTQGIVIPKAKQKRQDQSIVVYEPNEMRAFLERTPQDHRLRFLIVLAMETGCRIGELLALEYSDIDAKAEQIRINKSVSETSPIKQDGKPGKVINEIVTTKSIDSVRSMPMNALIKKEYAIHKDWHKKEMLRIGYRSDHVFTSKAGELYFASNTRMALKRLCDKINKDYNKANKANAEDKDNYKDVILVECKGWHAFRHTYGSRYAAAGVPIEQVCKLMGHSDISVTAKYYLNVTSDQKMNAVKMVEAYEAKAL